MFLKMIEVAFSVVHVNNMFDKLIDEYLRKLEESSYFDNKEVLQKNKNIDEPFKCPHCGFKAVYIYKEYGKNYLKCQKCQSGHYGY